MSALLETESTQVPRQTFRETIRLIHADIKFRCAYEKKDPKLGTILKMMVLTPGATCIVLYRWQTYLDSHHLSPIASILRALNLFLYSASIDSRAKIAGGLAVVHAHAIFISDRVEIGPRCLLFHQNTISFSPFADDPPHNATGNGPTIGSDVIFGAGACAYGDITIGDHCKIGVNATVDNSFPARSVLFGVPARQVSKS